MLTNKHQTTLDLDKIVDKDFLKELNEIISGIPYIQRLISPQRRYAKDMPKDKKGRVKVDFENPHILEDMDYFRPAALHFEKYKCYTRLTPNSHPKSEYTKFWQEEKRRCIDGYVRESDGEWIPGYYYFYLNYSPILLSEDKEDNTDGEYGETSNVRSDREREFARVWDSDYLYFHYVERAEALGKYCVVLKTRGRGYSFKGGAMPVRNALLIKESKSYFLAHDKQYLNVDGIWNKSMDTLDWCAMHTPWPRLRHIDKQTDLHVRMGYVPKNRSEVHGMKSELIGASLNGNSSKARGKRGKIVLWEEAGKFPELKDGWRIARMSLEQGRSVFGLMIAFGTGGCLTAGNKVWNNKGELINIEDLNVKDGIIGYNSDNNSISLEPISYWQKPTYKDCIKLTTNTRRTIECSYDHPLFTTVCTKDSKPNKYIFKEAIDFKIGDKLAIADEVNVFGNKRMWNPYLTGLLIGDGTYGYNQTVRLANADKEIVKYVENNFNTTTQLERLTKDGRIYKEIAIKGIRPELRKLGIIDQTKNNKTLPDNVHQYSKEDLCSLLAGFYDADGYISIRKNKKRDTYIAEISLSSSSENLLNEVRFILQKFGIHGTIRKRLPRKNKKGPIKDVNPWFEFNISDKRSLIKFSDNIKLLSKEKQSRLDKINIEFKNIKHHSIDKGVRLEKITSIEFTGNKRVYNLTADKTHTYIGNGIITHNTEGADFEALEELFNSPKGYGILPIKNLFDLNGDVTQDVGFFVPEYMNRENCYDKNGNSDVIKALKEIIEDRLVIKRNAKDPYALIGEKADRPITPQEAVMRKMGSYFEVASLLEILSNIKVNERKFVEPHYTGDLLLKNGKVEWSFSNRLPIREYPAKEGNKEGCTEIFQMPQKNSKGEVFPNRYILGVDTYDDDRSTTNSLGSCFVFDMWTDRIVAEFTGRPTYASDFYEVCRRLAIFYNGIVYYENNKKGFYTHFKNKHALSYLAKVPEILVARELVKTTGFGNTAYGVPATEGVNHLGRELQAEWQKEKYAESNKLIDVELHEDDETRNMDKIRSMGYIEECIKWNIDGNFDRVSAMNMVMIGRADRLLRVETQFKSKIKKKSSDPFLRKAFTDKRYIKQNFELDEFAQ